MNIFNSMEELIGNTPLLRLKRTERELSLGAAVYAKLECFNPAGSVKDRVAKAMIDDAEKLGLLEHGSTIIEPTSGNTGIGLAAVGAARGYKVIVVMPETMSVERRKLMKAYGAEIVLTDGKKGMKGSIEEAERLKNQTENAVILGQFTNPANPKAHYEHTAPEIYDALGGKIDIFVAGVGTGGTITGVGRYLKEKIAGVKVVAVEPSASPVLSGGKAGAHGLQGIGAGFVPEILDTGVYDEIIAVSNDEAFFAAKAFRKTESISVGISSGAALHAATVLAARCENRGKNIVVLLPDGGDRYMSSPLFD